MLQDVIDYVKKVAKEDLDIEITENTPPPKDQQSDKPIYVILTRVGTPTSDMCGNVYNKDILRVMGATANFDSNKADEIASNVTALQEILDELATKLVAKTRNSLVTLNPTTDIMLFNPRYTISHAGIDKAERHVYELALEVQWLSMAQ